MKALSYNNHDAMLGETMNTETNWIENSFYKRITHKVIPHWIIIILITSIIIYFLIPEYWMRIALTVSILLFGVLFTVYLVAIYRKKVVCAVQILEDGLQIKYKDSEGLISYPQISMFSFLDELDKTIIIQTNTSSSIQLELGIENNKKLMTLLRNKHPSYVYEDGGYYSAEAHKHIYEQFNP